MAAAPFSLEGLLIYMSETFTAGVIQSYQGQGMFEDAPLIQGQDPLEDFKKFDQNDEIFQEYDPPLGNDSKMGWKESRPPKWAGKNLHRQNGGCRFGKLRNTHF